MTFKDWTPEMAEAHNMRVRAKAGKPMIASKLNVTVAPKKKKPLLNKTEGLWLMELVARGAIVYSQSVTLRLGDGLSYRPDFVTVERLHNLKIEEGQIRLTAWETKAPHRFRKEGIVKIKAAAKIYPWIRFVLVMRKGGKWTEKEIGNE